MAFYDGPGIVTNGLVLALDASDRNSYFISESTWRDLAENSYLGTFSGSSNIVPSYNPINGGNFIFNGTSQALNMPSATITNDNFTMEVWCKPSQTIQVQPESTNSTLGLGGQRYLIHPSNMGTNAGAGLSVGTNAVGVYEHGNSYLTPILFSSTTISDSVFTHIVIVYISKQPRLYINGVLVRTGLTSLKADVFLTLFRFGMGDYGFYAGNLAIARYYNRSLSADEVLQNYNAQKLRFEEAGIATRGLITWLDASISNSYPGSGTNWNDISSNGYVNLLTNGPTYSTSNGGIFTFDGVNDYSYITSTGAYLTSGNYFFADTGYAWTVSAWFRFPVSPTQARSDAVNAGNCSYTIVGMSGGIATGATFVLFVGGTTTTYGNFNNVCAVNIRGTISQISPSTVNTNTWNNVVITWDGTSLAAYFNGSSVTAPTKGTAVIQTTYNFNVGATGNGTSFHCYEGSIGPVLVYNRAISSTEVVQNYESQKSRFGL